MIFMTVQSSKILLEREKWVKKYRIKITATEGIFCYVLLLSRNFILFIRCFRGIANAKNWFGLSCKNKAIKCVF